MVSMMASLFGTYSAVLAVVAVHLAVVVRGGCPRGRRGQRPAGRPPPPPPQPAALQKELQKRPTVHIPIPYRFASSYRVGALRPRVTQTRH